MILDKLSVNVQDNFHVTVLVWGNERLKKPASSTNLSDMIQSFHNQIGIQYSSISQISIVTFRNFIALGCKGKKQTKSTVYAGLINVLSLSGLGFLPKQNLGPGSKKICGIKLNRFQMY